MRSVTQLRVRFWDHREEVVQPRTIAFGCSGINFNILLVYLCVRDKHSNKGGGPQRVVFPQSAPGAGDAGSAQITPGRGGTEVRWQAESNVKSTACSD
jgi:hypothetical protein